MLSKVKRVWTQPAIVRLSSKANSSMRFMSTINPQNMRKVSTLDEQVKNLVENSRSSFRRGMIYNAIFLGISGYLIYRHLSLPESKKKKRKTVQDVVDAESEAPEEEVEGPIESDKKVNVRFSDCKGMDEIVVEFKQIADLIANKEKYQKLGAEIPRGILLTGPPGTGKTMLAKALATETNCAFIYRSGSDFESKYHGESAKKVRKVFSEAGKLAPCIIFIDEIDSIAGKRNTKTDYKTQTLNQLLIEMDGFASSEGVFVVGATNLEESIDPAMLRAGRFDKTIRIPAPSLKGRLEILNHYIDKVKCDKSKIDIDKLAKLAVGMTGAQLRNIVNLAAIRAVRARHSSIQQEDLQYAFDRVMIGLKGRTNSYSDPMPFAIHEAGHAIAALLEPSSALDVIESTILPINGQPGNTSIIHLKEEDALTKSDIVKEIDVALAGRIAEEIVLGKEFVSTNCRPDLQNATRLAFKIVKDLGSSNYELIGLSDNEVISDDLRYKLEKEMEALIEERVRFVTDLLTKNKALILKLADQLVNKETLTKIQIARIINN